MSVTMTQDRTQRVDTPLGGVDVPESQLLQFPDGLRGFPHCRAWVLLAGEAADTLWLQSADEPGLALLLVDPFNRYAGFALDVPDTAVQALGATQPDELLVFAPLTLGHAGERATANLRGPILINWQTRRGMQLVVDGGPWTVREPLPAAA